MYSSPSHFKHLVMKHIYMFSAWSFFILVANGVDKSTRSCNMQLIKHKTPTQTQRHRYLNLFDLFTFVFYSAKSLISNTWNLSGLWINNPNGARKLFEYPLNHTIAIYHANLAENINALCGFVESITLIKMLPHVNKQLIYICWLV